MGNIDLGAIEKAVDEALSHSCELGEDIIIPVGERRRYFVPLDFSKGKEGLLTD